MPGLYNKRNSLVHEVNRRRMTYNFKSIDRNNTAGVVTGMGDQVSYSVKINDVMLHTT